VKQTHRSPRFCGDQRTAIHGHLFCRTALSATQTADTQKSISIILLAEFDVFVFHIALNV
jgi:hypothetical protein